MIALILGVSLALADEPCSVPTALVDVREHGSPMAYKCLIETDEAATSIVTELLEYPSDPRLSRALAMWMLQRADTPFNPVYVEKLSPSDRRLVADGVRARRGRPSPVPEHAAVFKQFAWYAPVATYTDGRLKPGDKEQIGLMEKPRPTSVVVDATLPKDESFAERLRGALGEGALEKIIPAVLVLLGIGGAAWYLRRPKT